MLHYTHNKSSKKDADFHLQRCSNSFIPPLHTRVNIESYSEKLITQSVTFEAWLNNDLIGLLAGYLNDYETKVGYISNVSVVPARQGEGIASQLVKQCINHAKSLSFNELRLSVNNQNISAYNFYVKHGFSKKQSIENSISMSIKV